MIDGDVRYIITSLIKLLYRSTSSSLDSNYYKVLKSFSGASAGSRPCSKFKVSNPVTDEQSMKNNSYLEI